MKGSFHQENFILYLQLESQVDETFIRLAAYLKELDIVLVPVRPGELSAILNGRKQLLICFINKMATMRKFNKFRKLYLDVTVNNGDVGLFLLSSFDCPKKWHLLQRNGGLGHLRLPLKYKEAAKGVAQFYFERFFRKQTWPGGRRVKLPSLMGGEGSGS